MPERVSDPPPRRGLLRIALRLPLILYRANLGWLLGHRFLALSHTGRVSGKPYQTVLEVVHHNRERAVYYVASGWGERSDWFLNVMKNPHVEVQVGRRRFTADAMRLPPDAAAAVLLAYAQRNPIALRVLARFMGYRLETDEADIRAFAELVPIVALHPI